MTAPERSDDLILLVDDDDNVRRLVGAALNHLGYSALTVSRGQAAVEAVRARPWRFAAVILDIVMPGMSGGETFQRLATIRPDLPVIACSGYAPDDYLDDDLRKRFAGFLQKPFSIERLEQAIRDVGVSPPSRA